MNQDSGTNCPQNYCILHQHAFSTKNKGASFTYYLFFVCLNIFHETAKLVLLNLDSSVDIFLMFCVRKWEACIKHFCYIVV